MKFTVQKEIQVDRPRIMRVIKFCGRGKYTGRVQGEAGRGREERPLHSEIQERGWKPKGVED